MGFANSWKEIEEVIKEQTPGIFGQSFSLLIRKNDGYTVVSRSLDLALLPHIPTMPANPLNYQCMQEILRFRTGLSFDDYIYFQQLSNTDRSFNAALGKGVLQTPQLVLYKLGIKFCSIFTCIILNPVKRVTPSIIGWRDLAISRCSVTKHVQVPTILASLESTGRQQHAGTGPVFVCCVVRKILHDVHLLLTNYCISY